MNPSPSPIASKAHSVWPAQPIPPPPWHSMAQGWTTVTKDTAEKTLRIYVQLYYSTLVIRKSWLYSIIIVLPNDLSHLPLPHFRIKFWPPMTLAQNMWKQPPEVQQYLVHQPVFFRSCKSSSLKKQRFCKQEAIYFSNNSIKYCR